MIKELLLLLLILILIIIIIIIISDVSGPTTYLVLMALACLSLQTQPGFLFSPHTA